MVVVGGGTGGGGGGAGLGGERGGEFVPPTIQMSERRYMSPLNLISYLIMTSSQ